MNVEELLNKNKLLEDEVICSTTKEEQEKVRPS